jgi:hypothetical protein
VVRLAALAASLALGVVVLAASGSASSGVHATFVKAIPADKAAGEHVLIAWKVRDSGGHPVSPKRMFVKIVCPTGDSYTTTLAKAAGGIYRANAVVPPGGIGTVTIHSQGKTIPATNPFHR